MWLFLIATNLPLFCEIWYERSFRLALRGFVRSMMTCSFVMFIFQAKLIGYYVTNELRYGGASYVATGRGLPTERRPFMGKPAASGFKMEKVGGLYLNYAHLAHYDGMNLVISAILIRCIGGVRDAGVFADKLGFFWLAMSLTIISWIFGPYLFNPYQFMASRFKDDLRAWVAYFVQDHGNLWVAEYNKNVLHANKAQRQFANYFLSVEVFISFFLLAAWYSVLNLKLKMFAHLWAESGGSGYVTALQGLALVPPAILSISYCIVISLVEARLHGRRSDQSSDEEDPDEGCCGHGIPLVLSTVWVTILCLTESILVLWPLLAMGWTNTFVAGCVLKISTVGYAMCFLGECLLRSRVLARMQWLKRPVELWVHAHRMARDLGTSAFILLCLTPLVLINSLNEKICPGCNLHTLFVYRDPGHMKRQEAVVYDVDDAMDNGVVNARNFNAMLPTPASMTSSGYQRVR